LACNAAAVALKGQRLGQRSLAASSDYNVTSVATAACQHRVRLSQVRQWRRKNQARDDPWSDFAFSKTIRTPKTSDKPIHRTTRKIDSYSLSTAESASVPVKRRSHRSPYAGFSISGIRSPAKRYIEMFLRQILTRVLE
jgi:hypothetical protein